MAGEQSLSGWGCVVSLLLGRDWQAWPELGNGLCCCQERELCLPAAWGMAGQGRAVSAHSRSSLQQEERGTESWQSRGEGTQVLVCPWQLCSS